MKLLNLRNFDKAKAHVNPKQIEHLPQPHLNPRVGSATCISEGTMISVLWMLAYSCRLVKVLPEP